MIIPSLRSILCFVNPKYKTIKEKIVKIRISIIFSKIKVIGLIVAAIPKTNKILKTF